MTETIRRIGSRGILVELPDLPTVMAWHAELTRAPLPGQIDVIAATRTLLLSLESPRAAHRAREVLHDFTPPTFESAKARSVTIDVLYDGEDVAEAATLVGMSPSALIGWHTSTGWLGAFGGFAPGFTYCVTEDPSEALDVPRRSSPRTAVPAGAVGLAGGFSAVYPRQSPGGWQLIGSTTTPMWDSSATPPALIAPGDRVTYRAVREHITVAGPDLHRAGKNMPSRPVMRVEDSGLLTLIQDLGRPGNGDLGVTESGAADRASARAANAAVGNDPTLAVLENIGGMSLTALVDTVVAVTGALAPVTVGGRSVELGAPALISAGEAVSVGAASLGLRSYVAVRGGFTAEQVLGSSATDMLSGLGPIPVTGGTLAGGFRTPGTTCARVTNPLRVSLVDNVTHAELRCVPGPRENWFEEGVEKLASRTWEISGQSNRVGLRLEGTPLTRAREGELASEGIVAGSVQVPANGLPLVFLRDHAVTGGYPVVATVVAEDLDVAAQLPPGSTVRFIPVDPDTLLPSRGKTTEEKDL